MEVVRLKAVLEAETRQAEADLARAGQNADRLAGGSGRAGGAAQAMGRAFSAAGATAGYMFASGIESAATFQDGLATINTVARLSDKDLAAVGDGIQQLARDTGKSTEDLTAAYYDMVSAGIKPGEAAMQALRDGSMLAIGGLGTTAEATDLLTTSINAWGLETSESGRIADIWATAVEGGKTTIAELGSSVARAAPLAASMGVEMEEVAAAIATMTAKGVPTAQAFTQIQAAMTAIQKPNERLLALQEQLGVSFADVAAEDGLAAAYEALQGAASDTENVLFDLAKVSEDDFPDALAAQQEALGLSNTELDKFIAMAGADGAAQALQELAVATASGDEGLAGALGSVEALQYGLLVTGENADSYAAAFESAMDASGTAAEQAAIKMESPTEGAARMTQNITTWMQDVAGPFTSSLAPMLLTLNNLGPAFLGPLSPARLLGTGIGWVATKGLKPLLTGIGNVTIAMGRKFGVSMLRGVAWVSGFAGALIKDGLTALGNFVIGLAKSAARMVVWGATMLLHGVQAVAKFVASLAVQAARALAGFATSLLTSIGRIAAFGAALAVRAGMAIAGFVTALAVQAVGALGAFAATIFTTAIPAVIALAAPFLPIILAIGAIVAAVAGLWWAWENNFLGIRDIAETVWNAIVGFVETAWTNISNFIGFIVDVVSTVWDGAVDAATTVWEAISGVIETIVGTITGIIGGIVGVVQGVWDAVSGFFDFVTGGTSNAKRQFGNMRDYTGQVGGVRGPGGVPEYAEGTLDTGRGGLAMLHPREAVLPEEVASSLRSWLGAGGGAGAGAGRYRGGDDAGRPQVVHHNYYTAKVDGVLPVRSVRDVGRGLRELGETGQLTRRDTLLGMEAQT